MVSADGLQVCEATGVDPGQELRITMPTPAALIVCYSIPGDEANAVLNLTLRTSDMGSSRWTGGRTVLKPTVPNGGQLVLTNLTPGTYEFCRTKMLNAGGDQRGVLYERRTIALEAGQTQQVDLVRSIGHAVQGKVMGLDHTHASGGYIYVRSAIATGDPHNHTEWLLPSFDALVFGNDGLFQTALLEPGDYTIVAEVYGPDLGQTENMGDARPGCSVPEYVCPIRSALPK